MTSWKFCQSRKRTKLAGNGKLLAFGTRFACEQHESATLGPNQGDDDDDYDDDDTERSATTTAATRRKQTNKQTRQTKADRHPSTKDTKRRQRLLQFVPTIHNKQQSLNGTIHKNTKHNDNDRTMEVDRHDDCGRCADGVNLHDITTNPVFCFLEFRHFRRSFDCCRHETATDILTTTATPTTTPTRLH